MITMPARKPRRSAAATRRTPLLLDRAALKQPAGRRHVRRTRHRRRHHRGVRRARRRLARAARGADREGRLRLRHVVEVLEDGARRSALHRAGQRQPGPPLAPGAAPLPQERPAPGAPAAVPLPDPGEGGHLRRPPGQGFRGPAVDVRPGRRLADREAAPAAHRSRGPRAGTDAACGEPQGRADVLRRPHRRRPSRPHHRPDRRRARCDDPQRGQGRRSADADGQGVRRPGLGGRRQLRHPCPGRRQRHRRMDRRARREG